MKKKIILFGQLLCMYLINFKKSTCLTVFCVIHIEDYLEVANYKCGAWWGILVTIFRVAGALMGWQNSKVGRKFQYIERIKLKIEEIMSKIVSFHQNCNKFSLKQFFRFVTSSLANNDSKLLQKPSFACQRINQ